MTISSSYDFSTSRDELIRGALRLAGGIAQGETPTTEQTTEAAEALNMLVKSWQVDGMPLWVISEYTLALVNGTNTYTVSTPKLLKVIQAWNRNTVTNIDIPMRVITRDEYNRLGNKTSSGNPIQIVSIPNRTDTTIKVFPTPDSNAETYNEIHLVYQKPYSDFDAGTDEPEFPSEYFEALKFNLAHRLSPEYGMTLNDRKQLLQEAVLLKTEALGFGSEEGSLFFGVTRDY
jgi:hypothetical protein